MNKRIRRKIMHEWARFDLGERKSRPPYTRAQLRRAAQASGYPRRLEKPWPWNRGGPAFKECWAIDQHGRRLTP